MIFSNFNQLSQSVKGQKVERRKCVSWVAEDFSFIKQRLYLFPDSHWFPRIEPELTGTLTTKDGDPDDFMPRADISFAFGCLCRRGSRRFFFLLPLHIYSFYPKQDGHWKQTPGHLGIFFILIEQACTQSGQGKGEPCQVTVETWPCHLA